METHKAGLCTESKGDSLILTFQGREEPVIESLKNWCCFFFFLFFLNFFLPSFFRNGLKKGGISEISKFAADVKLWVLARCTNDKEL